MDTVKVPGNVAASSDVMKRVFCFPLLLFERSSLARGRSGVPMGHKRTKDGTMVLIYIHGLMDTGWELVVFGTAVRARNGSVHSSPPQNKHSCYVL